MDSLWFPGMQEKCSEVAVNCWYRLLSSESIYVPWTRTKLFRAALRCLPACLSTVLQSCWCFRSLQRKGVVCAYRTPPCRDQTGSQGNRLKMPSLVHSPDWLRLSYETESWEKRATARLWNRHRGRGCSFGPFSSNNSSNQREGPVAWGYWGSVV